MKALCYAWSACRVSKFSLSYFVFATSDLILKAPKSEILCLEGMSSCQYAERTFAIPHSELRLECAPIATLDGVHICQYQAIPVQAPCRLMMKEPPIAEWQGYICALA